MRRIRALREMTTDQLTAERQKLEEQLFKLRFQKSMGKLENPMKLKLVRRDIARVATLLRESVAPRTAAGGTEKAGA